MIRNLGPDDVWNEDVKERRSGPLFPQDDIDQFSSHDDDLRHRFSFHGLLDLRSGKGGFSQFFVRGILSCAHPFLYLAVHLHPVFQLVHNQPFRVA